MATALAHHSPLFGKYKILETLAVGGMGRVELALNKLTGELVAIKRLREQMVWRPAARSMFEQERRLAARFDHPNITKVHESGEHDSEPFMVMEYLRGQDLRNMVNYSWERGSKPDVQVITGVLYQACLGLHHVHELTSETGEPLGIIHRDISHSNIFITETGVVKVLDFGIAKSQDAAIKTKAGVIKGKIRFMSPEQARAQPLDRRTDVFSMGVVLWEALAGGQLFKDLRDVLEAYVPSLIEVRPDVPPELTQVVAQALRRDPDKRWQTVDDLGRALAAAMAPLGGIAGSGEIARVLGTMSEPSISIEVVSSDRSTPDGNPPMDIPGVTLTDVWLTAPASAPNDQAVSPDAAASPAPAAPRRARTLRLPSTAPQPAKDRTWPAPARGHGRAVFVAATLIATLGTLGLWWAL